MFGILVEIDHPLPIDAYCCRPFRPIVASDGAAGRTIRSFQFIGVCYLEVLLGRLARFVFQEHHPLVAATYDGSIDYVKTGLIRSEERRVGKECRYRWST